MKADPIDQDRALDLGKGWALGRDLAQAPVSKERPLPNALEEEL